MARNPHFKEYTGEQDIVEELTIEIIKTMGKDMVYIPRTLLNKDELFGEDSTSKFDDGYEMEMYIQSVDGFEGEGDVMGRFGIQIRDRIELIISRKRFEESVGSYENTIRPKEGDLIFFPLSNTLFEINFVEHENPFYQLGKLFTYKLSCEVFTYSEEVIDTGYSDVDKIEEERKKFAIELELGTRISTATYTNYFEGETIFQVLGVTASGLPNATATAVVTDWDASTTKLTVTNIVGTLSTATSETVKGAVSGAEYELSNTTTTTLIIPNEPEDGEAMGDGDNIELLRDQDDIVDFTETDPFSEGNF